MNRLHIETEAGEFTAELRECATSRKILDLLPIEGTVMLWGEEIYVSIPMHMELEPDARADVSVGDLAYWPDGPALCLFFGSTPMSTGPEPRAYSAVSVIGALLDDPSRLKTIREGSAIRVVTADP
ncbi:MAG: cyclophilin-like fold protein [Desulfomonilia bacterium]|nr:cyclophilin-like fold protein [Desulfomonilia bacterium]